MNATNIQTVNNTIATKASKKKSLSRIKTFSSPGRLPKLDVKKSAAFAYETEGKNCENSSKIPRPQVTASYSYNETLKSNLGKSKTKKAPSMIPRSKSRKRSENDKVKFDLSSKEELNNVKDSLSRSKKSVSNLVDQEELGFVLSSNAKVTKSSISGEDEKENMKQELIEKTSLSLKSCEDGEENMKQELIEKTSLSLKSCEDGEENMKQELIEKTSLSLKSCEDFEIKEENSDTSYKDAQESIVPSMKASCWKGPLRLVRDPRDRENHELDEEKQQRTVRNLYETIKTTVGPLFENLKWTCSKKIPNSKVQSDLATTGVIKEAEMALSSLPDFLSAQDHYEFTLKEISNIWKNAISLIGSVKDHTIKFVEENNVSVDREQLTLEVEMLQLAIDFAINYSKLKTDILIKSVRKTLNVKDLEKTELEAFIDSKTFAAVYSDEDLTAMARTVEDLNLSVLKGEDVEFE